VKAHGVFLIVSLSKAAVVWCPGGCRLSTRYSRPARGHDKRDNVYFRKAQR